MRKIYLFLICLTALFSCKKSDDPGIAFQGLELTGNVNTGEFAWIQKDDWNFSVNTQFCAASCINPTQPGPCQGASLNLPPYWHFAYSMTQDTVICWDFNPQTLPADPYCHVIDIGQAPAIQYLGKFQPPQTYLSFSGMKGGYLYAIRDVTVLAVYDIRNLDTLGSAGSLSDYEVGHFQLDGITYSANVHFAGDAAYVGGNGSHIYILDVSNPAQPVLKGDVVVQLSNGFREANGYLYSMGNGSIDIIDIHDPFRPVQVARLEERHDDIQLRNGYLYVATSAGLKIYDVSSPADPKLVRFISTGSNALKKIYFFGDYIVAYAVDGTWYTPYQNRLFFYPNTP